MLFQFEGPILKNLLLRTNPSKSELLAVQNGSFAVFSIAVIHAKVLVFVGGFDMQVRLNPAVVQVYGRVQERYFFSGDHVAVNLMVGWRRLSLSMKFRNNDLPWVQMAKTSSINLHHSQGLMFWVSRNSCSSLPMDKLAKDGAIRVPMAVP